MGDLRPYHRDFERSGWDAQPGARTFSVGIFQWLPKTSGQGLRKSKTIRVLGYVAEPDAVYAKAQELCQRLKREHVKLDSPPGWLQKQYSVPAPGATGGGFGRKRVTAKDRLTQMVREVLEPELKEHGFRRLGRKLWRNGPGVCQVIDFPLSRWGTATSGTFDVALGVFWHEIEAALHNPSAGKMPPPEYRCTFRIDLGWATPAREQKGWQINRQTALAEVGREILGDLVAYGLPWLEYRSTLEHVLEWKRYARSCGRGTFTTHELPGAEAKVLFMLKLGKLAGAKQEIASWPSDTRDLSNIHAFARRLGVSIGLR